MPVEKPCGGQCLSRTVPRKHTPSLCVGNRAALSWKKTVHPISSGGPARPLLSHPSLQLSDCPQTQLRWPQDGRIPTTALHNSSPTLASAVHLAPLPEAPATKLSLP